MGDIAGTIGKGILELVLPTLATVIAGYVVLFMKRLAAKHGVDLTEKQEERLKQIVVQKVHAVEEMAHRDPGMTGPEKHEAAVQAVVAEATADNSIPNPSRAKASDVIDATLGATRAIQNLGQSLKFGGAKD